MCSMHWVHYRLSVRWLQETKIVNLTPCTTNAELAARGDVGKVPQKYCSKLRKVQVTTTAAGPLTCAVQTSGQ